MCIEKLNKLKQNKINTKKALLSLEDILEQIRYKKREDKKLFFNRYKRDIK